MEENQNTSHPTSNMLANVSQGGAHETDNFPFVDGNPFTATLWVGLDGFHMTVNGRHETSFAYREVRYEFLTIMDEDENLDDACKICFSCRIDPSHI